MGRERRAKEERPSDESMMALVAGPEDPAPDHLALTGWAMSRAAAALEDGEVEAAIECLQEARFELGWARAVFSSEESEPEDEEEGPDRSAAAMMRMPSRASGSAPGSSRGDAVGRQAS